MYMRHVPIEYIEMNNLEDRVNSGKNKFKGKTNLYVIFLPEMRRNMIKLSLSNDLDGGYIYDYISRLLKTDKIFLIIGECYLLKYEDKVSDLCKNEDGNVYIKIYNEKSLQ